MADQDFRLDDREFQRWLQRAFNATGDLSLFFRRKLDPKVIAFIKNHYDTKGQAGGTPWPPLAPSTQRIRANTRGGNRGGTDHPLWNFGKLRASLIKSSGPDTIKVIKRDTYIHGTRVFYAQFHQLGVPAGSGARIPARPMIVDPPPTELREWGALLQRWLDQRLS